MNRPTTKTLVLALILSAFAVSLLGCSGGKEIDQTSLQNKQKMKELKG